MHFCQLTDSSPVNPEKKLIFQMKCTRMKNCHLLMHKWAQKIRVFYSWLHFWSHNAFDSFWSEELLTFMSSSIEKIIKKEFKIFCDIWWFLKQTWLHFHNNFPSYFIQLWADLTCFFSLLKLIFSCTKFSKGLFIFAWSRWIECISKSFNCIYWIYSTDYGCQSCMQILCKSLILQPSFFDESSVKMHRTLKKS